MGPARGCPFKSYSISWVNTYSGRVALSSKTPPFPPLFETQHALVPMPLLPGTAFIRGVPSKGIDLCTSCCPFCVGVFEVQMR